MIRVRIAEQADQQRLVQFIHDYWSASHIFTQRPEVFAWQHLQDDGRLNMVIAESDDAPESTVLGVLGFIPMGRFSPALGDADLMLAIWKVRDGAPPGLGLRLLKFLKADRSPRLIAAIGTSQMVRPIYEVLGYQVGKLSHDAIFHPMKSERLSIASGVPAQAVAQRATDRSGHLKLRPVHRDTPAAVREAVERIAGATRPTKNWEYIVERYLEHPWYRYNVRLVVVDTEPVAVVVWRAVAANDARALRIVDIIGETSWLAFAHDALQSEVIASDAEYIDLMHWGVDESALRAGGFIGTTTHPELVLPNYFSPFEARNVEIEIAFKVFDGSDAPVTLFRADADQDRPNLETDLAFPDDGNI